MRWRPWVSVGAIWVLLATGAAAEDRFWIFWERIRHIGQNCPNSPQCQEKKTYAARPLDTENTAFIYRLFGANRAQDVSASMPAQHPEAPKICSDGAVPIVLGFDPDDLPRSEKLEVLRGINTLHVDLTGLKPPPGHDADFGKTLHDRFVARLAGAGVTVVDAEKIATVAGQPVLNLYFSFTDPDANCDYEYSVFASLTQEVLLTRDLRIKVTSGVWSFSTGSRTRGQEGREEDAILAVADAFLRDRRQVNPR